jgi:spore germination protein GerM
MRLRSVGPASVGALVLVLAACGVTTDDEFRQIAAEDVQFRLADPTTTTTSTSTTVPPSTSTTRPEPSTTTIAQLVELYFVSGETVIPVTRAVPPPVSLAQVIRLLEAGPVPGDPSGARSLLADGLVLGVDLSGGVALVDLSEAFTQEQLPSAVQQLIVAQLVYTMAAQQGVGQVAFTLAGQPIAVPLADGSVATGPISRDAYRALPTTTTTSSSPPATGGPVVASGEQVEEPGADPTVDTTASP